MVIVSIVVPVFGEPAVWLRAYITKQSKPKHHQQQHWRW